MNLSRPVRSRHGLCCGPNSAHAQPKPASVAPPQPSPTDVLLAGKPSGWSPPRPSKKPVEIVIRDLYEGDGRVLVRYAVRNRGTIPTTLLRRRSLRLLGALPSIPLWPVDSQLGDQEAARLTANRRRRFRVLEGHVQSAHLAPGQESLGIVAPVRPSVEHRAHGVPLSICE